MSKILLLEDDEALALGIEFTLKKEGFDVIKTSYVEDFKKTFNKEKFDLLILDVTLPDGNGFDVCKEVRKESDIPIIFLTACDDEVNVVLGLEIGGDDYITKPFRVRELTSRIKAILRRASKSSNNKELGKILKSGDIVLNTANASLIKFGESIQLTAQEYRLLLIFMNNANIVLSRDTIFNKLLENEDGIFMDDNTLYVYIKRLREKIETDSKKPEYIVNQRGIGYKWNKDVVKE
ncbi:response regulator transcription factor [Clostridium oceanicum]|uniref:Stage 0 sporulation protein A homolog n=1 Tax=Clostridium oceanicum TaxID=1543 RepID=A0ABP3ULG2_9CLOT